MTICLTQVDIGQGVKPRGYYIQTSSGLFPAPWPQNEKELDQVCGRFHQFGILLAKSLQDGRLIDLPLSHALFKLLCQKRAFPEMALTDKEVSLGLVIVVL